MNKRISAAAALVAVGALVLAGCAGGSGDGGGDAPIVVGSVNTISGPATFPEASQAAKAVFDAFNAAGGLNGRTIDYKMLDDKGDPATATASAREIVGSDNAVALVGSASLIECEINAKYYQQEGIRSIPGIGVDTGCFDSENISPANVGPFNDMTLTLMYGSEALKLDDICVLLEIAGSTRPTYQAAIDKWTEITGKKPKYVDDTVPYGASDYTPYIVKAREAGCKALAINPVEPDAIGQVKAANAQGWNDVTWLYLTSVYSENFAQAIDDAGAGIYVPAEFYPFSEENETNKEWRDLMTKNDIPLTSFSQGGYLAATYFIEVLKTMKGDINRETVSAALASMKPIENPMIGTPYTFGVDNTAGWPIVLKSGTHKWEKVAEDWFRIGG
ncbi:branched-chain amino acid transport system substrate-binding protein [Microbacterium resistens]|uniref:Branched-chain amino acid transport system substrate-binding protein n=1 Tax=Microbacterium resistens TaxID=156977 RepID=A0ABU1SBA5_9MICO|nr:ABC transporter substrate-binding protein [Microbacterium resistens]MDR6866213.1 branched-chain amino acid transport system substrate-binding protein [Microbacterium resistens]